MSQASSSAAARARAHFPALLASTCLALYYALSMSRDLSLYDSGELALAAEQLGLGHPPGQPLHTLLGFVLSKLTWGAPLVGINLLSAAPSALCVLPATRIASALCGPRVAHKARRFLPWLCLPIGLHESVWEPATRVEVYALATFCGLCAVASALPLLAAERAEDSVRSRAAWLAGVLSGLCACANPGIAVAVGVALAPGVLSTRSLRLVLRAVAGGLLGLLPYAYLAFAAARSDEVMVWGGLGDSASVLRYLTLGDYAHKGGLSAWSILEHALAWSVWALEHLLVPGLIYGLGGFLRGSRFVRFGTLVFSIVFGMVLLTISRNAVWDLEVPDYNGYLAITYWLAAAGGAALFASSHAQRRPVASSVIALCLVATIIAAPAPWQRTRHSDQLARHLAEQVLREAPQGAIVISYADYYAGSLMYLQEAERQRPDVSVLAYGLSGSSWHWRHLMRQHPDLAPVDLARRGDRATRIRDWLAKNAARPVLVEQLPIARELGIEACPGGLYLRTGAACSGERTPPIAALLLASELAILDGGSPSAAGAIAQIGEQLGTALWQLGDLAQAHDVLLAAVPRAQWPAQRAEPTQLTAAGPAKLPLVGWQRQAALGDPARNLFLAGALVAGSGHEPLARAYLQAAARLRLPEALRLLER